MYKEGYIICPPTTKERILEELSKNNSFFAYTFMTLSELKRKLTFDVKKRAVIEISKYLNVRPEIAKVYVDSLMMTNGSFESDKGKFLYDIYDYLEKNNLLIIDNVFKYASHTKHFTFVDYNDSQELRYVSSLLNIDLIDYIYPLSTLELIHHKCHMFNSIENEVSYTFNQIMNLVKSGISINDILLCNLSSDYYFVVNRIAKNYGIPVQIKGDDVIITSKVYKDFIDMLSDSTDFNVVIECLKGKDDYILSKLVEIINDYELYKDKPANTISYWKFLTSNISYEKVNYSSSLKTIKMSDLASYKDKYIFILNFDINALPILKDERFISDDDCLKLNIDTTAFLNKEEHGKIISALNQCHNLTITFSKMHSFKPAIISPLVKELNMVEINHENDFKVGYSKEEDDLYLAKSLDSLIKYNDKNDVLVNNYYSSLEYNTFNNKYNGKDKNVIKSVIKTPLNLSYTDLHSYFSCPFQYYCKKVLKIDEFVPSLDAMLGTYAHAILEDYENQGDEFDFLSSASKGLQNIINDNPDYDFTNKDLFYFDKMKNHISFVISKIKEHKEHSILNKTCCEKKIDVKLYDGNLIFKGFIDKLWYNEESKYIAIIDYKTGKDKESLDNLEYGENLQLPVYIYLLKNNPDFKDYHLVGFYLQKINITIPKIDEGSEEEQISRNLRLEGYTNPEYASIIDDTCGVYLKNYNLKKDGAPDARSKIFDCIDENKLYSIVEDKIEEAYQGIINGKFDITVKRIDGNNVSCGYCRFKDVCFKKYTDIVELDSKKWKDGGNNADE